ncbi:paralemmin-1-like [Conger conger]|uniref:paralemmin-1-like n=1 Tax=Conger conger TaxID=82655 RepID=UPI002A59AFC5|nr:paralemmin-1-like [Conger conger]
MVHCLAGRRRESLFAAVCIAQDGCSREVTPELCALGPRMSEAQLQERMQVISEKRRQLEDVRRLLQHLKSKALRDQWLLDGAPSAGLEDQEAETQSLRHTIQRLEHELEELETGEVLQETRGEEVQETREETAADSVKEVWVHRRPRPGSDLLKAATFSVEIRVERNRLTGDTKVLSSSTMLPKAPSHLAVKVYEDDLRVVHAVCGPDSVLENGLRPLSSSEVDELIHKADAVGGAETVGRAEKVVGGAGAVGVACKMGEAEDEGVAGEGKASPRREIRGLEAQPAVGRARVEHPVSMVFMGYQEVEDEGQTKRLLGLQGPVTAQLVHIPDPQGPPANGSKAEPDPQGPPANGSKAEPDPQGPPANGSTAEPDPQGPPANGSKAEPDPQGPPANGSAAEPDPQGPPANGSAAEPDPQGPPANGSAAEVKGHEVGAGPGAEPHAEEAGLDSKEKQPCRCCLVM